MEEGKVEEVEEVEKGEVEVEEGEVEVEEGEVE